MSKAASTEVARIRALARMAREEGISELSVEGATFKLEPAAQAPDKPVAEEEVEPVEGMSRALEEDLGLPVDRAALREFLGNAPAKKGRSHVA